ncbi:flavin monoamine oxidase family protein [Deinococcus humi]|uniref:Monoamine oxidase n=1 Tax=Deinococcus humi TaxID=662880 RepID=A0A7W8NEZ8_9DEIO|nr:FAD-dependent oxidoreductase [Deinococcus humi]MBB5363886.1 monoamine oxidase [Deinococcus humi]GGO31636.1 hypothetical protein GCM10008949_27910 [Deinococcus humi]
MSRTPLFGAVRRIMMLAGQAERRNIGAAEAMERQEEAQATVSRRGMLRAGAVGAAALALSGAAPALAGGGGPRASDPPVVIIGAGVAGLVVAYRLHKAGIPYQIYEASGRAGGRMSTLRGHFPRPVELGGEFIDSGHTAIRALARELALPLIDLSRSDSGVIGQWYDIGGQRYTERQAIDAFRPLIRRIDADYASLGDSVNYRTPQKGLKLDRLSIREYLEQTGAEGWLLQLLDVAYNIEFGLETSEQSSLNFITLVGTEPGSFQMFGESDERYGVMGGNDRIPLALARVVGARTEYGTRLEAVRKRADGQYLLTLDAGGTRREVMAPQVVFALPFTMLRQVDLTGLPLPTIKRRAIAELGYGTNAKLIAGFTRRVWREQGKSSGEVFTDQFWQNTWESSRGTPVGGGGTLTNFLGGKRGLEIASGSAESQTARWLGEMNRIFPGLVAARSAVPAARADWPNNPYVRASYASYRVGQWTSIGGAEGEAVGGVHFCGEHTSAEAQGYMEGGVESGERVARELLLARRAGRFAPHSAYA